MSFLPKNFDPPKPLETEREHLWEMFGEVWGWPPESLTLEEDLIDLAWHQKEGEIKSSFNYAVMSLDEKRLLGCVYVVPSEKAGAEIAFWVRKDGLDIGLEEALEEAVRVWISSEWPFEKVLYPGRDISWGISTRCRTDETLHAHRVRAAHPPPLWRLGPRAVPRLPQRPGRRPLPIVGVVYREGGRPILRESRLLRAGRSGRVVPVRRGGPGNGSTRRELLDKGWEGRRSAGGDRLHLLSRASRSRLRCRSGVAALGICILRDGTSPRRGDSGPKKRPFRLLERVGLRREGSFVESFRLKGEWTSEFLYAILANEWTEKRG